MSSRGVDKAGRGDERAGPVLEFRDVWFSYDGPPVLEALSFSVQAGDFVALLGPNGSGKSTLLKLALGLLRPRRGRVTLFGGPPSRAVRAGLVGYVPQTVQGVSRQLPATVEEVVAQGLYRGFDPLAFWRPSGGPRVRQAMEEAGVASLRGRRMASLSVGQQQRVLIARALVRDPRLLVLDEPEAGVDVSGQEQLHHLLRRLREERGVTVLMVSHDIGAVLREASQVACVNRRLVYHGPPDRLTPRELSALYGFPPELVLHREGRRETGEG